MRYFVIAECSINHLGNMDTARKMVDEAEQAGADAVKFQYYYWNDIKDEFSDDALIKTVQQSQLSLTQLSQLQSYARGIGIGFVCTPFKRPRRIGELMQIKPDAIKIRYKDFEGDPRMVDASVRTDVPLVLVSCNTPTVDNMSLYYHPKIRWLSCIPKYPPEPGDFNWTRDSAFHGFSDHYPHITASLLAAGRTSQPEFIIEKHVMLDEDPAVPDRAVSINFQQLQNLVAHLRLMEKLRPDHQTHWLPRHRG